MPATSTTTDRPDPDKIVGMSLTVKGETRELLAADRTPLDDFTIRNATAELGLNRGRGYSYGGLNAALRDPSTAGTDLAAVLWWFLGRKLGRREDLLAVVEAFPLDGPPGTVQYGYLVEVDDQVDDDAAGGNVVDPGAAPDPTRPAGD